MKWNIVAPFFRADHDSRWIDDAAPPGSHVFRKVPFGAELNAREWHTRASRGTPLSRWASYWNTARKALSDTDGVITVFPQLAVMTALRRKMGRRRVPIIAWCFNLGHLPGGIRRAAARAALSSVDYFVVHSKAEISSISNYLGIPADRVRFIPLQRAAIPIEAPEETLAPFVVAMGSANRDYPTLIEAARLTGLALTIVASPRSIAGIEIPDHVTVLTGLTGHECRLLAQRARFSVIPLSDVAAASGQVTVIEAQRMGRAVIATRSIGTVDYIDDGATGLLVPPGDPQALASAMMSLWQDEALRTKVADGGLAFAETHLSDEAAGRALLALLDEAAAGSAQSARPQ